MDILLVIAAVVILLAVLGFTGVLAVLRAAAWLILALGLVILALGLLI